MSIQTEGILNFGTSKIKGKSNFLQRYKKRKQQYKNIRILQMYSLLTPHEFWEVGERLPVKEHEKSEVEARIALEKFQKELKSLKLYKRDLGKPVTTAYSKRLDAIKEAIEKERYMLVCSLILNFVYSEPHQQKKVQKDLQSILLK